jgi:hypothetical protein
MMVAGFELIKITSMPSSVKGTSSGPKVSSFSNYSDLSSAYKSISKPSYIASSIKSSYTPTSKSVSKSKVSSRLSLGKSYKLTTPSRASSYLKSIKSKTTRVPRLFKPFKQSKQPSGRIAVFGRRFGKFKPIGFGRTEAEAFSIGKQFARNTLGVTFKVPTAKARKVPGYITKFKKGEVFYIEPNVRRLKRGTKELPEIQYYQKLKGGKLKNVMQI